MKSRKFPVFSLMIREFDAESSSHQTASSATQSAISLISVEDPKIVHKLARFLDARGPEKLRWGRQRLASARFSPSRTEPVPFSLPSSAESIANR